MDVKDSPQAPPPLELVRAFVNTLDVEASTDALADADGWSTWARSHDLTGDASDVDLALLRALREAIRTGLLANHDRDPLPEETRHELNAALRWCGASPQFAPEGLRLQPAGDGARLLGGHLLSTIAAAAADGTWSRLKACRDDACRWAFYDHSRSRTRHWCHMEICGNRNKQARWRQRRASDQPG
ncbi:CGNR zinc finger domain-containing protein [Ornithinimicrobium panacihumi]|uniref:CGNR zinc finger domain-containing protein n=1 Tax=Ornithinimicrobium panacihumi TaxID=2008449 RepID=UPI003F8B252D